MTNYQYKVIYARPGGFLLWPWAKQELKDIVGRQGMEKQINKAAAEGWEVVSCSTASTGSLLYFFPMATIVLRREGRAEHVAPSDAQKGT